jgi:hypothetical protein
VSCVIHSMRDTIDRPRRLSAPTEHYRSFTITHRMKTIHRLLLLVLALNFTAAGYGQTAPTPLRSVQEGVYFFQNNYSTTVLELMDGNFQYWFRSDVRRSSEPAYPLTGNYTTSGGVLTLPHKEIYETNWTCMSYDGKPTLWRPSALKYWEESKKIDPYGVLFLTTRKPGEIWDANNKKSK